MYCQLNLAVKSRDGRRRKHKTWGHSRAVAQLAPRKREVQLGVTQGIGSNAQRRI